MQDDDPYNFSEPVNILDQISKDFWEGLASAKWTERRDALQNLSNLAAKPKLATGDYGDVMRELRKVWSVRRLALKVRTVVYCNVLN